MENRVTEIEVFPADFARLQKLAVPLVDTPASVVSRLLDAYEKGAVREEAGAAVMVSKFENPPPQAHTKVLSGKIGIHEPEKATWDAMVSLCFRLVAKKFMDVAAAGTRIGLNTTEGKKTDEGYKYVADLNASYQGVSAQHAAKVIGSTARILGEDAYVDFIWREKEDAHAPGRIGSLSYALSS